MISIFYSKLDDILKVIQQDKAILTKYNLPEASQKKITSYYKLEDQARSLISEIFKYKLLASILNCHTNQIQIDYDGFYRPFLLQPKILGFDFNISHSGNYILIAISDSGRVGVDIEFIDKMINYIELCPLTFSSNECNLINSPLDFFNLWSKKEALIKAAGKGFLDDMYQSTVLNHDSSQLYQYNNIWYQLEQINLDKNYTSYVCLATPNQINNIKMAYYDVVSII